MINKRGFTIVELLIATTVFSMVLLIASAGLIYVGRTYFKGLNNSRTQEAARSIIDEISREIQFSGGTISFPSASSLCIGDRQYGFTTNRRLVSSVTDPSTETDRGLVLYQETCGTSPVTPVKELLTQNMRLETFSITAVGNNNYEITVRVIYGDEDLSPAGTCVQRDKGGEYCAVSGLTTTVQKRIQ